MVSKQLIVSVYSTVSVSIIVHIDVVYVNRYSIMYSWQMHMLLAV